MGNHKHSEAPGGSDWVSQSPGNPKTRLIRVDTGGFEHEKGLIKKAGGWNGQTNIWMTFAAILPTLHFWAHEPARRFRASKRCKWKHIGWRPRQWQSMLTDASAGSFATLDFRTTCL